MKHTEWLVLAIELQARWPNKQIPDESIEIWFGDLAHLPAEQVEAGIRALYRDGREWCPTGAQILAKVSELGRDDPDHGEAWRLAKKASLKADPKEAAAWLRERCPAAAEAVRQLCGSQLTYMEDDEPTVRAQFRDVYRNVCERRKRADTYAGLPSAGLPGLERLGAGEPRKIGTVIRELNMAVEAA